MKKRLFALTMALAMVLGLAACGGGSSGGGSSSGSGGGDGASGSSMRVAMVTDYGDITDQSFNQNTYEACKAWSEANGVDFIYYKPAGDSDAERVAMIESAVDDGYNVIVLPGYAFGNAVKQTSVEYDDVTFVALDVGQGDLGDFTLPSNLYCVAYQGEQSGYMAGYAAVKLGYTHLGFLGGMAVPGVKQFGYGFVQGVDAAAAELGTPVVLEYVYGNKFSGDADITAYMDTWYQSLGVQVVFACGGGIWTSAAEAAAKVGGKVIGVDVDQAGIIDGQYGEGMTVTSALKGLAASVHTTLDAIAAGTFDQYGGTAGVVGVVSDNPEENFVQLPLATTQWGETFTEDDYRALVADMNSGAVVVNGDVSGQPGDFAANITLNTYADIK